MLCVMLQVALGQVRTEEDCEQLSYWTEKMEK